MRGHSLFETDFIFRLDKKPNTGTNSLFMVKKKIMISEYERIKRYYGDVSSNYTREGERGREREREGEKEREGERGGGEERERGVGGGGGEGSMRCCTHRFIIS